MTSYASSLLSTISPIPTFPPYPGPYEVGTLEVELPIAPFVASGAASPAPSHTNGEIPTILFRIFYPASLKGQAKVEEDGTARWIPSPRKEYLAGFAKFLGAGPFLANVLSYISRMLYYITI